jgi:hypothetical protein
MTSAGYLDPAIPRLANFIYVSAAFGVTLSQTCQPLLDVYKWRFFKPHIQSCRRLWSIIMDQQEETNYETFRDILSTPLIEKSTTTPKHKGKKTRSNSRRKTVIKPVSVNSEETNDAEELVEFIECKVIDQSTCSNELALTNTRHSIRNIHKHPRRFTELDILDMA